MPSVSQVRTSVSPGARGGDAVEEDHVGTERRVLVACARGEVGGDIGLGEEHLASVQAEAALDARGRGRAVLQRTAVSRLGGARGEHDLAGRGACAGSPSAGRSRSLRQIARNVAAVVRCMLTASAVEPQPWASRAWARRNSSGSASKPPSSAGTAGRGSPASAMAGQFSAGNVFSRSCSPARSAKTSASRRRAPPPAPDDRSGGVASAARVHSIKKKWIHFDEAGSANWIHFPVRLGVVRGTDDPEVSSL